MQSLDELIFKRNTHPVYGERGSPVVGKSSEHRVWTARLNDAMSLVVTWSPCMETPPKELAIRGPKWTNSGAWCAKLVFQGGSASSQDLGGGDLAWEAVLAYERSLALATLWFRLGDWQDNASTAAKRRACMKIANALRAFLENAHNAFLGYFAAVRTLGDSFPKYLPTPKPLPAKIKASYDGRVVITANPGGEL